ncbi:hypothetical protein JVT61DRAFT_14482 [Boletus reticuloceps]|uniref:DUF202 domain-containing protein n=1 Tax=Boletus reticuloceps TaxID=495285 RepID=A0A8I2YSX8_9AGAM|nr:hypothetical protein JVT61DRAFT_14482 [Boletus reticuloceps]
MQQQQHHRYRSVPPLRSTHSLVVSHKDERGHRANSFLAIDLNELTELRARSRTFNGAYRRSALANLGYAITVLRLFDRDALVDTRSFVPTRCAEQVGILFLVLSALLFGVAYVRARHSRHDFADRSPGEMAALYRQAIPTKGQEQAREFGRPFVTAGLDALVVALIVFAVEVVLLVLILQI